MLIIRVSIISSTNSKEAPCELYRAINILQNPHPDRLFIVTGDFKYADLKPVLSTTRANMLVWFAQTFLMHAGLKQVRTWPAEAIYAL